MYSITLELKHFFIQPTQTSNRSVEFFTTCISIITGKTRMGRDTFNPTNADLGRVGQEKPSHN